MPCGDFTVYTIFVINIVKDQLWWRTFFFSSLVNFPNIRYKLDRKEVISCDLIIDLPPLWTSASITSSLCIETFDMSLLYSFFFPLFHCKYIPDISWASWKRHACLFLLLLLNIFSPWFCVCLQWFFIHRSENSYFVRQFHSMSKMRNTQLSLWCW